MDCLFCRIVEGSIPSTEVASSELSYAFRDLNPQAPTHVLIVPRRHITNVWTVRPEDAADLADMVVLAQKVAAMDGLIADGVDPADEGGYRLVFNVGEISGNTVHHLHMHVVGGRRLSWPPG